ncbi:MAG: hypothetical protein JW909_04935 [Planctomycetes bacterium]|nr:hypothetical protein [Planctomycetota bacterium]
MKHLARLLRIRTLHAWRRTGTALSRERFKVAVITVIGTLIWLGVMVGLKAGLRSLNAYPAFKELVVSYLVGMFFFVVMMMLFFSSTIVSYGALFSGSEIPFLLTGPTPVGMIYVYRLLVAFLFSAWAVAIMGLPVVAAYGADLKLGTWYYAGTLAVLPPFLLMTAAAGGAAALLLTRFLGRYRRALAGVLVTLGAIGALYAAMRWPEAVQPGSGFGEEWMFRILGWFTFSRSPWYPSTWATKAMEAAATGDWGTYALYTYTLYTGALAAVAGGRVLAELFYRRAYEEALTASVRARARMNRVLWWILRIFAWGDRRRTAYFYKDTVTFFRDPLQWGQGAIFFGLILVYFLGLKRFGRMEVFQDWRIVTVSLSFMSVALTMATFTTRFAFPLVSMEMRVPWGIMGGTGREEMVRAKFAWTAWGSSMISVGLLLVGAMNMGVGAHAGAVMLSAALGVALTLSAISVGMGTMFPEPSKRSPSEMVSSFGGTLTLVASILTVAFYAAILVPALKVWMPLSLARKTGTAAAAGGPSWATAAVQGGLILGIALILTTTVMLLARRAARRLEW